MLLSPSPSHVSHIPDLSDAICPLMNSKWRTCCTMWGWNCSMAPPHLGDIQPPGVWWFEPPSCSITCCNSPMPLLLCSALGRSGGDALPTGCSRCWVIVKILFWGHQHGTKQKWTIWQRIRVHELMYQAETQEITNFTESMGNKGSMGRHRADAGDRIFPDTLKMREYENGSNSC